MAKKLHRDVRVAIVAIVSLVVLYVGIDFLKGITLFSPTRTYYVVYDQVEDLSVSNPIHINGYTVGQVSAISILQNQGYRMLVSLRVNKSIVLRETTVAELQSSSLLGGKTIALLMDDSESSPLAPGDTLRGQIQKTLTDFLNETQVGDDIASATRRINTILTGMEGAGGVILHTLENLDTMSASVRHLVLNNQRIFDRIVSDLSVSAYHVRASTTLLDSVLRHTDALVVGMDSAEWRESLSGLRRSIDHVEDVLAVVKRGEGSLGRLVYSDSLYEETAMALGALRSLLTHLETRPRDFLSPFGRTANQIERRQKRLARKASRSRKKAQKR